MREALRDKSTNRFNDLAEMNSVVTQHPCIFEAIAKKALRDKDFAVVTNAAPLLAHSFCKKGVL